MVYRERKQPDVGEIVIGEVININPNSLFLKLDDYNLNGMIHVSELSTGWVKDIRKFAKKGQKLVVKVISSRNYSKILNLSLKMVKPSQKKAKLEAIKNEKKAVRILGFISSELKIKKDSIEEKKIYNILADRYGTIYDAFSEIARDGINNDVIKELGEKQAKAIDMVSKDKIKIKNLAIKGKLTLKFTDKNGIDHVKKALDIKNHALKIKYISAPEYMIELEGQNYADIEKKLASIIDKISDFVKSKNGQCQFAKV